jgi:RNA recognition motif-containing protein
LASLAPLRRSFGPLSATLAKSANQEAGPTCLFLSLSFVSTAAVTKLYVGNLPFTATDEAVRALFSKHGTVEKVSLITDRETNRPRGFGFVEMSNADASRATQALNGTDFDGRTLKVNEAQDRERSGGGGGGNRGGGYGGGGGGGQRRY